ncbi:MAG: heavy-metal-associated domain-containing protein [Nitrospirota bacterium]|jgi:copper chaperone
MAQASLKISGMHCHHCVQTVRKALQTVPGVAEPDVKVGEATVTYDESKATVQDMARQLEKLGYTVQK